MPFNNQTETHITISKEHKRMLLVVRKAKKVFMRKLIEDFIEREYAKATKHN